MLLSTNFFKIYRLFIENFYQYYKFFHLCGCKPMAQVEIFSKICHDECILPVSAEAAGIHVNTNRRKIQEFLIESKERMKQNHAEGPAMESFCSMAGPVSFPIAAAP